MQTTKLFIVLNEDILETMKIKNTNKVAKFKTAKEANMEASKVLELWSVIDVHFNHPFINHQA